MSAPDWMKFAPAAFIVGTVGMTAEQRGIYIMLLCLQWEQGGSLPTDHETLAAMCGVPQKQFDAAWKVVGEKFEEDDEGYFNPRGRNTLDEALHRLQKRQEAGKKGAQARWQSHGKGNADAITRASDSLSSSDSACREEAPSPYSEAFEEFWNHYPHKVGKGAAWRAWEKADLPDLEVLVDAVERWKRTDRWRRGYITNPATWLNQRRWDDEPESLGAPADALTSTTSPPLDRESAARWISELETLSTEERERLTTTVLDDTEERARDAVTRARALDFYRDPQADVSVEQREQAIANILAEDDASRRLASVH